MTGLSPEQIALLLQEEASQPARTRKQKTDPTADRSIGAWFKLAHHLCTPDCPHRVEPSNPTAEATEAKDAQGAPIYKPGNACWNPNCLDEKRDKVTDRGTNIVFEVKGQMICRYCYLGGYLV